MLHSAEPWWMVPEPLQVLSEALNHYVIIRAQCCGARAKGYS